MASLEGSLDRVAEANPQPGRPLVHRLNRAEYANAIRDLLALEIDPAPLLPADDSSAGFDNVADVLGLSPVLLESYLSAAGRISALAIGDPKTPPMGEVYRVRQDASQSRHVEGLPLGTVGGFTIRRNIPLDGEYEFKVRLFRTNLGTMRGLEFPHQLEISVDGARVHLASFGGDKDVTASSDNPTTTGDEIDGRFTVRVPMKAGPRDITVTFLEKTHGYNSRRLQSYIRSSADTIDFSGHPHIDQFLMTGPFNPTGVGDTPSRRAIFVCHPCLRQDSGAASSRAERSRLREKDPHAAGAPRVSRRPHRRRPGDRSRLLRARTETGRHVRRRHRHGAAPRARQPEVPDARRTGSRRSRAGNGLPDSGPGARVAPVVLPLEQHSRRRAARQSRRRAN